jgi:serine/threonine-protein kinase RsbW
LSDKIFYKEIESDPNLLPELDEFLLKIAEDSGMDKEKFNNLSLSFSEAASNSIVHGNKKDKNKKVGITIKVNDSQMTIIIKDEGKGFKVNEVPDPTKPENILKDSGRGIHIMRSFLNELKYNFTPDGTETILVLNLK